MMFGLNQITIDAINTVFGSFPEIEQVIIYGSRAKGNYKNGSDIDLTFKGDNLNSKIINKIANQLDDLLLPYTFDLSIFNQLKSPDLIKHIERIGAIFYEK